MNGFEERALKAAIELAGITRIANLTGLDCLDVPVWSAVRPMSLSLAVSQGKGEAHEHAKIAAVMESLEGFHAERPSLPSHVQELKNILGSPEHQSIFDLPLLSNARLFSELCIRWVEGVELSSNSKIFVPYELVDLDFLGYRHPVFNRSSVGLAGGLSSQHAILHSLCEIIENDQTAFWIAGMPSAQFGHRRRLKPKSINDIRCVELIERIHCAGLKLAIWYTGCELLMPSFSCVLFDDRMEALYPIRASGHGAHPYKGTALFRAIVEAIQSRLTFISGGRDDFFGERYASVNTHSAASLGWREHIAETKEALLFGEISEYPHGDDNSQLQARAIADLASVGCEKVIAIDLTREDVGIPFVKLIVPLAEIDPRDRMYTPGARMARYLRR